MRIGILAIQGDYEAHGRVLERMQVEYIYVRQPQHLYGIDGLIIPGGESPTILNFLSENQFLEAIKDFSKHNKPIMGTCAGAILLAKEVTNPKQSSLELIDVAIERNAYGRQLASHIGNGTWTLNDESMEMVFIRAPKIRRLGKEVKVLAHYENEPVCVIENRCLITTFHPELTEDLSLHQYFINHVRA